MHGWYGPSEFLSVRYYSNMIATIWNTPDTDSRVKTFYDWDRPGFGLPAVVMDGLVGTQYEWIGASTYMATGIPFRNAFETLQGMSPYKMSVTNFNPAGGTVDVKLDIVSNPGSTAGLVIRTVLYENNLMDGADRHDRVTRDILQDYPVTISSVGQSQTVSPTITLTPGWKLADLGIVAFVQKDSTKEIFQSASVGRNHDICVMRGTDLFKYVPLSSTWTSQDVTVWNTGTAPDLFDASVGTVPAGWTANLRDGAVTSPTLSFPLDPGTSKTFKLEITSNSRAYATVDVQIQNTGDPTNLTRTVSYSILNEGFPILLVDDDGGATYETYYTGSLDAGAFEYGVWPTNLEAIDPAAMRQSQIVIWNVGQSFPSIDAAERTAITDYLAAGGKLFITGQDVGWDLCDMDPTNGSPNASAASKAWYEATLHALYVADTFSQSYSDTQYQTGAQVDISGSAGDPIGDPNSTGGLQFHLNGTGSAWNQRWPDEINANDAVTYSVFYYPGWKTAAVRTDGCEVVYFGFGFEGIPETAARDDIMEATIECLGLTQSQCPGGDPGRIVDMKLVKNGANNDLTWTADSKATDGYNLYSTSNKTSVGTLNSSSATRDKNSTSASASYANDAAPGVVYYQVLGVCGGGVEGPN